MYMSIYIYMCFLMFFVFLMGQIGGEKNNIIGEHHWLAT